MDVEGNSVAGSKVELSADTRISIAHKIVMGETSASEEQKAVAGDLMLKIGREQEELQEEVNKWQANDILQDKALSIEEKANKLFIACKTLHDMQPSSKMEGILGWTQQFILGTQKLNSEDKRALHQAFLKKCEQEGASVPEPRKPTATEVHQVGHINPKTITLKAAFDRLSLILNEDGVSASLTEKIAACREFTAVVKREIHEKGEDSEDIRSIRDEFKALQNSLKLGNPATPELNTLKQELEGANRDLGLPIY